MPANISNTSLALKPLGAGDLIDRAFRLYRRNFWTFVWIATPPILVGSLFSIGWAMLGKVLFNLGSEMRGQNEFGAIMFGAIGGVAILVIQLALILTVMGGSSRNFVRHLLFGESISFRETYKNISSRLFSLLTASLLMILLLGFFSTIVFYLGITVEGIGVLILTLLFAKVQILYGITIAIWTLATTFGAGWCFFWVASRFAYIPQIMLVEGQNLGSAIVRSMSLASGNANRIYALFIFTFIATISATLLLYVPLGWIGYVDGIEYFLEKTDSLPTWYLIAAQIVSQLSLILLSPIIMIGLCLLYIDERVRHEGYDIELLAARNLGQIPNVPSQYINPLQPALAVEKFPVKPETI